MNANQHLLINPAAKGKARKPSRTKVLRLEWQEAQAAEDLAEVAFINAVTFAETAPVHLGMSAAAAVAVTHSRWSDTVKAAAAAKKAYVEHLREVMSRAADPRRVRDAKP